MTDHSVKPRAKDIKGMSECESSSHQDTMDSCDVPNVMVGDKNTLNYSPCSVEVDCETQSPRSEAENLFLLKGENIQLKNKMNIKLDKEGYPISSGQMDVTPSVDSAKRPGDSKDISGEESQDENGNPDPAESSAEMLEVEETTDVEKSKVASATAVVSNTVKTDMTKTSDNAIGDAEEDQSVSPLKNAYCHDEIEPAGKEYLNQNRRPIYMVGSSNTVNININGRTKTMITMRENTKVHVNYIAKKQKVGSQCSPQGNPTIKITIEDTTAEDAAFLALHSRPVRTTLDTLFDAINLIVDSILPGSIVIEIKPTSKHSIQTLLESMNNGKLDSIIKEILNQESVFKHIRGREVTVTVELDIPEELLQKEGIVIVDDLQSDISITLIEGDDNNKCDQSSSVDPPNFPSAGDNIYFSVDQVSDKQTSSEVAECSPSSDLILPKTSKRYETSRCEMAENIEMSPILFAMLDDVCDEEEEEDVVPDTELTEGTKQAFGAFLKTCRADAGEKKNGKYRHTLHEIDSSKEHELFKELQEGDELLFINEMDVSLWSHNVLLKTIHYLEEEIKFTFRRKTVTYIEHDLIKETEELYIEIVFVVSNLGSDDKGKLGGLPTIRQVAVYIRDKICYSQRLQEPNFTGREEVKIQHGAMTKDYLMVENNKPVMKKIQDSKDAYTFMQYGYTAYDEKLETERVVVAFKCTQTQKFLMCNSNIGTKKLSLVHVKDDDICKDMTNVARNAPYLFFVIQSDDNTVFLESVAYPGNFLAYDEMDLLRVEKLAPQPNSPKFISTDYVRRNFTFSLV